MGKAGAWLECDHCSGTGATRCPVCVFTEPGQICLSCGGAGMIVCGVCNGTGKVFDRFFDEKGYEKDQEQLRKKREAEEAKKKKHVQTLLHKMEKAFLLKNKLYQKIIQEIPNIPSSFYVSMNPDKFMSDYRVLFQKLIAIPEGEILISRMLDYTGYKIKLEDLQTGIVERYRKTPPPQVPEAKTAEEFCFLGSRGFRDPQTNVWIHEPMFIEKHQSANGHTWYQDDNGYWRFFHNAKLSTSAYSEVINFEQRYTWAREEQRNKWVYVDAENDVIIAEGTEVLDFDQEITWIKNGHWSLYDLKKQTCLYQDKNIDSICPIDEHTFWVSKFNHHFLWGIMDITGKWMMDPQVKEFKEASFGVIPAKKDYWGYINKNGHWIVPPKLREASVFDQTGKACISFFFSNDQYTITLKELPILNRLLKRTLNPKGVKAWVFKKTH